MKHDTQTCNCEMCAWADQQEHAQPQPPELDLRLSPAPPPPLARTFSTLLHDWSEMGSKAITKAGPNHLNLITELVLAGNRLLLEANLMGQVEAFKTVQRQKEACDGLYK